MPAPMMIIDFSIAISETSSEIIILQEHALHQ
jgi:hypothetical protein